MESAESAIDLDRRPCGVYKIMAMAKFELAKVSSKKKKSKRTYETKPTLKDAIRTMSRNVRHEAPWGAANRLINEAYLQELLGQAGVAKA